MIPRADNAIFFEQPDGTLRFDDFWQDDGPPATDTGYKSAYTGDSGSPYWMESEVEGEARQTVLAVHNTHYGKPPPTIYSTNALDQCRMLATKVTADVVNWIKTISDSKNFLS